MNSCYSTKGSRDLFQNKLPGGAPMKDKLTVFTKHLLDFMFFAGIPVTCAVPFLTYGYGAFAPSYRRYMVVFSVILILSGVMALQILYELRRVFATVIAGDCFKNENTVSLSKMGRSSFVIAAVWCVRIFLDPTPSVFIIIAVFIIAGLFSKVLSRVFGRAVAYKIENDLTI